MPFGGPEVDTSATVERIVSTYVETISGLHGPACVTLVGQAIPFESQSISLRQLVPGTPDAPRQPGLEMSGDVSAMSRQLDGNTQGFGVIGSVSPGRGISV